MTNNQWDDDKLEKLLHSMPKIEDKRSKEQVLDSLKRDRRLKNRRLMNGKRWIPALITVAALLLLSLLVPSMLNSSDRALEPESKSLMYNERAIDSSENETIEESAHTFDASSAKESTAITYTMVESNVLLADELYGSIPFRVGLVEAANVIPITFLIPESVIHSDFPESNPNGIDLYNRYAAEIPEAELGFDDYHPYKGTLYEEDGIIHHQITANHPYDLSSATVYAYFDSMRETFSDFEKLQLVDEQGQPTSFDSVGTTNAFDLKKRFPYFRYVMPSGKAYLVPSDPAVPTDTVVEALAAMKEANGDFVEVLIPQDVTYDVRVDNDIAVIKFKEQLDFTAFDQNELNQMIEGFMLTASSYGMQVRLENVVQESFGKYDLTTELPVPIGSNPTYFPE